jgi:hypothetical protein
MLASQQSNLAHRHDLSTVALVDIYMACIGLGDTVDRGFFRRWGTDRRGCGTVFAALKDLGRKQQELNYGEGKKAVSPSRVDT